MVFMRSKLPKITGFCGNPLTRLRAAPGAANAWLRVERGIPGPRARLLGHPRARIAVVSRRCGPSANRTQPNIVIASHTKNAAFAATSAAPNSLWFRRVATAATRYTPTGNNPHTKKRGVQREVRRSRPDKGRGHQQRYWTSAGQSERGRQHAQRHRRPEEQDRLPEIHQIKPALLAAQALEERELILVET